MHLRRSGLVRRNAKVATGEQIGKVGSSGNATGCHLTSSSGRARLVRGRALQRSVTKHLRRWDRAS